MSTEAILTSHLSISYSAAPTASGTPAPASGSAAPGNATGGPGKDMAGFLAALVDQLLAGAATTDATATATADDAATSATPSPFGGAIDPTALSVVQSTVPRGNILIKQLTQGLQALQDQLDKGETPDPDLLKRLGDLADAIAAMINVPATASTTVDPKATLDPLAVIGQSGKPKTDPMAGLAGSDAPSAPQPTVPDQVAEFLASLGLQPPTAPSTQPTAATDSGATDQSVAAATPAQPLPAIAQLADRLSALTQTIAAASPAVAQKLDALAKKLDAAEGAPQALAQLTVASDTDGTELDRVVQALLAAKPANPATTAAPTFAAKTELPAPAPIVSTDPQPDTTPALAAPASADAAATAATKVTASAKPVEISTSDDAPKAEAKIIAAATSPNDAKPADGPDAANQQNTTSAAAAVTSNAPARTIPAAYQAASSPINMGQVAFEMVRQVHQGTSRFSFRLDPPELGRVDVRMHVDASGTVSARLTVERSETLDMFQRDRGALEKALTQAGLDSGKTNLEFSLKQNQQNPFAGLTGGDQRPNTGSNGPHLSLASSASESDDAVPAIPSITLYRGIASAGGVNLFV